MFLIRRTSAPNYKKKSTALKLCVCECSRIAVEWGLAKEIFSVKIFFFALIPVFSVDFFYNIHSS